MAIRIEDEYVNAEAASSDYPHGSFKNESSPEAGDGTPVEKAWADDIIGLLQKLLVAAGITPSGSPDTVLASDYFTALSLLFAAASDLTSHVNAVSAHGGVSTATSLRLALRDAVGRCKFAPGAATGDAVVFSQFAASLAADGYQRLPSGLQLRHGYIAPASRSVELDLGAINFTPEFPNACLGVYPVLITNDTPGYTDNFLAIYGTPTRISFRLYSGAPVTGSRTYGAFWFAIGY